METRHPLRTHLWADGDIPQRITQDGQIIFHYSCVRCGRDFMHQIDGTGWQAAYVGNVRIEPLADEVTKQWVSEECPGRLLAYDSRSRAKRQTRPPKATNFG